MKNKKSERTYIAGPMRGYPLYNFPAFDEYAIRLRSFGYDVVSPAEMDREAGFDERVPLPEGFIKDAIVRDVEALADCDAIAMLPGWRDSDGAKIELAIARLLGLKVYDAETMETLDETVLQEAARITTHDRRDDYGHPYDDFTLIAKLWEPIWKTGEPTPEKVAMCMMLLKIAREMFRPKRDNRVDMAGYVNCLQMIVDKRKELSQTAGTG